MNLDSLLADTNLASWEVAFRDYVQSGKVAIDDWLWKWLWFRIQWPSEDYSLFYNENTLIKAELFEVAIVVTVGDTNKRRYVQVSFFKENPYHPEFEELVQVEEQEWRFSSIGNPYIDEPNYKQWERLLFCKLINKALEERKGLDFLIEQVRR
ncbi:hypothetical protein [Aureispira anguillae]|uniref:Uncharacterized protein n=1 Tax=Aureispira anguillae TaxID=2864201 RepID=A0A916DV41_9BACT|nr:hypothetical protein [Aureispira anguillae]BDS13971.1 hypothetical protein AsAng_0047340 [Aureispira anguillae]